MADLFASGRIVDLVLVLMVLAGSALAGYRLKTGAGVPLAGLASNLVAGAGLLLALRAALTGAPWPWIAGALLLAFAAHIVDLRLRWSR
jgi:hypothetical protein